MNTKKDIIKHLKFIYNDRGRRIPATIHLRNYKGHPQYRTYVKVFGSWKKALEEAGFNITNKKFKR